MRNCIFNVKTMYGSQAREIQQSSFSDFCTKGGKHQVYHNNEILHFRLERFALEYLHSDLRVFFVFLKFIFWIQKIRFHNQIKYCIQDRNFNSKYVIQAQDFKSKDQILGILV